ncbi:lipoyl(octanoyl) transferase LipB [Arenicellales bacterium nBUS_45]
MKEYSPIQFQHFGCCEYIETMNRMRAWTDDRDSNTVDQVWFLEHFPVYTQGVSCDARPIDERQGIPVIKSDRGGQITYHAPGQLIAYFLFDLKRRKLGVRKLVSMIEQATIMMLAELGLTANTKEGAPGVYIAGEKIAALGLRVRAGCSYHGLSINVDLDLDPFLNIHPCGYQDLKVTSLRDHGISLTVADVAQRLKTVVSRLSEL